MPKNKQPAYVTKLRALLKAEYGAQTRTAKATGIPRQTLANFANGDRCPSPERLVMIANALGKRIVLTDLTDTKG